MKSFALALVASAAILAMAAPSASADDFSVTFRDASVGGLSATGTQSFAGASTDGNGLALSGNFQQQSLNAGAGAWTNNGNVGGNTYSYGDVGNVSGALSLGSGSGLAEGLSEQETLQGFDAQWTRLNAHD